MASAEPATGPLSACAAHLRDLTTQDASDVVRRDQPSARRRPATGCGVGRHSAHATVGAAIGGGAGGGAARRLGRLAASARAPASARAAAPGDTCTYMHMCMHMHMHMHMHVHVMCMCNMYTYACAACTGAGYGRGWAHVCACTQAMRAPLRPFWVCPESGSSYAPPEAPASTPAVAYLSVVTLCASRVSRREAKTAATHLPGLSAPCQPCVPWLQWLCAAPSPPPLPYRFPVWPRFR